MGNHIENPLSTGYKKRINNRTNSDNRWKVYDSPIYTYEQTFYEVLRGGRIVDLLEGIENPTVIDLMAPAGTLYDMFSKHSIDGRGIAVSLEDKRADDLVAAHQAMGITQVSGDIMRSATWKEVKGSLGGKKADLIMERAVAGVENLPYDKRLYKVLLDKAWSLLRPDGGILLFEGPYPDSYGNSNDIDIKGWIDAVSDSGIYARYTPYHSWWPRPTFMLVRDPNSPDTLPTK